MFLYKHRHCRGDIQRHSAHTHTHTHLHATITWHDTAPHAPCIAQQYLCPIAVGLVTLDTPVGTAWACLNLEVQRHFQSDIFTQAAGVGRKPLPKLVMAMVGTDGSRSSPKNTATHRTCVHCRCKWPQNILQICCWVCETSGPHPHENSDVSSLSHGEAVSHSWPSQNWEVSQWIRNSFQVFQSFRSPAPRIWIIWIWIRIPRP